LPRTYFGVKAGDNFQEERGRDFNPIELNRDLLDARGGHLSIQHEAYSSKPGGYNAHHVDDDDHISIRRTVQKVVPQEK
jgi:hypothetical protein